MPNKKLFLFFILNFFYILSLALTAKAYADTTAPITSYSQTPSSPDGNNDWYVSPVQVQLNATDLESGVKEINYRIDGGAWQKQTFTNTLNLANNPSFETPAGTSSGLASWEASVIDGNSVYNQDAGQFFSGFATASARIISYDGTSAWHAINNQTDFAVASPFANMSASAWVKSDGTGNSIYFDTYSVSQDGSGNTTYVYLGQSSTSTNATTWTNIEHNFVVSDINSIGVYIDIGFSGSGTLWIDAVNISEALTAASANFTVSTDSTNHTIEYYSVDNADNIEAYSCPTTNCQSFKMDQTPPGNWNESGAFRGSGGAEHELFVHTDVIDVTSGLSVNSDEYQYTVDSQPGFGYYTDLIYCNTPWVADGWRGLLITPVANGEKESYLQTPRTDFCNSNWKICKTVNFYAEDMAGNSSTKSFCLNGPWIEVKGEGITRANQNIDMLAEAETYNTDGIIEIGGSTVDFFSSQNNWVVKNATQPFDYNYNSLLSLADTPSTINNKLATTDGTYIYNGNLTLGNATVPNNYDSQIFDQVVFVNGDLLIEQDMFISDSSTALFVVSGKVEIDEKVDDVEIAIIADGKLYTAYNLAANQSNKTLNLKGLYVAEEIVFQRTLQGTQNNNTPSESIQFEPKYLVQQRDLFGQYDVKWKSVE